MTNNRIQDFEIEQRNQAAAREEAQARFRREADAAEQERQRQEIESDPGLIAFRRQMAEDQQRRETEAELRRHEEEEERRRQGREELEEFARHQLNIHLAGGGDEESFRRMWPTLESRYFEQKAAGMMLTDEQRAERSTPIF